MRFFLLQKVSVGVVLCAGMLVWAQGAGERQHIAPEDMQILAQTTKQAAYAFSLGTWCTSKNRNGLQQYAAAVAAWQQRNHWRALEAGPVKTELSPGEYESLKAEALKEFNAHAFKTTFLCGGIANVLRQPEHDPSQRYGADLSRIAAASVPAAGASADTQATTNAMPPVRGADGQAAGAAHAPPVQNASPQAAQPQGAPAVAGGMLVAANGPVKVGDALLAPVSGWAVTKSTPDQVILQKTMREKDTRDAKLLVVLSVQPMQGSIDQSFPAAIRRNYPGPLELKYIHKGITRGGQEARTVRDGGRLNLPGNPRARVRAVGMTTPDGQLLLAMIVMRSDWESLMSKADDEFEAMITTLRFASQPESALWDFNRPPKGSGGQSGLYWSNSLQNTINPLGGMDLRAIRDYIILLPSGQAYRDLPNDGHVLDIDFATACKAKPKKCGTYEILGGTIRLRWMGDYGLVEESSGAWTPSGKGGFTAGANYTRVTPVRDLRVNGKFTSTFAMVGTTAMQSTSVVSEKYLTLTADGQYQKSGFSAGSFDNANAAGTFGGRKPVQSGTYTMSGYTLTLTPTGGTPEHYSLVLEDPSPNTHALFINDDAFLRKDGR